MKMKSNLTLSDWYRYDKRKRTAMMTRRDDGLMLKNNGCADGIDDLQTIDGKKHYTAVGG